MQRQLMMFDTALPRIPRVPPLVSGLEFHRGFLSGGEQEYFLRKVDQHTWAKDFDRRVQFYQRPFPPFAQELIGRLLARKLIPGIPEHASVMDYEAGVGIGHHVDRGPIEQVTIISLGHEYEMDLRHNFTGQQHQFMLELGSVLTLRGEARWEWEHGIRARLSDHGVPRGRRVSITFRNT